MSDTVSRELYEELREIKDDYKKFAHDTLDEFKRVNECRRRLLEKVEVLVDALSEARDFIMSGPAAGDETAIVNKISRVLEG